MPRIAMISVHTCPMATLGGKCTGGMNVYVRELSRELGRRGIEVDVFTRAQNTTPRIGSLGPDAVNVRVVHIPAGPRAPYPKDKTWDYLPRFVEEVKAFAAADGGGYDLIDAHYWLSGWVARELKAAWEVPWIQRFHTLGHLKNSVAKPSEWESSRRIRVEAELMADADILVAANPTEREAMVALYGAPEERIRIVPCGVDSNLFRPIPRDEALERVAIPCGHRMILYVGRIEPLKGIDTLLRAMALMAQRVPGAEEDLCLAIIGGDPEGEADPWDSEMSRLREMEKGLGLANLITFLGSRNQEDLPYYYAAAEVCVVPSRYESFGMVALEAMACGTPVIASRVGGLAHTVQDGITGYLVPEGDAQALADNLQCLLSDEKMRRSMGRHGARVAKEYSWPMVADSVRALYGELRIGQAAPSGG